MKQKVKIVIFNELALKLRMAIIFSGCQLQKCNECGLLEDRDIHAARNMIFLNYFKVGQGLAEFTRVDNRTSVDLSNDEFISLLEEARRSHLLRCG